MDTNLVLFIVKLGETDIELDWHFKALSELKGCSSAGFDEAWSKVSQPPEIPDISSVMVAFVILGWITVLFTILHIIILARVVFIVHGLDDREKLKKYNDSQHNARVQNLG